MVCRISGVCLNICKIIYIYIYTHTPIYICIHIHIYYWNYIYSDLNICKIADGEDINVRVGKEAGGGERKG